MNTNVIRLEYLTQRYFNNTITKEEKSELVSLIQMTQDDNVLKVVLEDIWKNHAFNQQMPDDISKKILANLFIPSAPTAETEHNKNLAAYHVTDALKNKPNKKIHQFLSWKYMVAAASVALIISFSWWKAEKNNSKKAMISPRIVSAEKGLRSKVVLPEGTVVWLNGGSRIEYREDFGIADRKVYLTGEAFFDVTPDKSKPFIIHTATIDVKVLGTTFNVRAYPNEKTTEASLITGSLEVSFVNEPSKKVVLKPAEKISVINELKKTDSMYANTSASEQLLQKEAEISSVTFQPADSSVIETSWVNNKLVFRNKPFDEAAMEMSRWYNVDFEFRDKSLMTKRFTGTFETETVYEALTWLSASYNFSYFYDKEKKLFVIDK